MRITQRVKKILDWYESDNPGSKGNLARILMEGKLGGTGKLAMRWSCLLNRHRHDAMAQIFGSLAANRVVLRYPQPFAIEGLAAIIGTVEKDEPMPMVISKPTNSMISAARPPMNKGVAV